MHFDALKVQIKDVPISTIIGQFIPLKRTGSSFVGNCPFHADKRPSFSVNDSKGLFKCFPCDIGGDAISFVQKFENIDFKEALKRLADLLGLEVETDKNFDKRNQARQLLNYCVEEYAKKRTETPFQEFLKKRNISKELSEKFQLGLSQGEVVKKYLSLNPEQLPLAKELGLVGEKNGIYESFRDRIIFPIWDYNHNVIGLCSRAIYDYQKAKYYNSPESFLFKKRQLLYGFSFAKESIRTIDQVILVEGNMDVIACHQAGITNVVAIMGVGVSEYSLKILLKETQNIILALDSDIAGRKAMERIQKELLTKNIHPKVIDFSPHKDADEYLNELGVKAFKGLIESAPLYVESELESLVKGPLDEALAGKMALLDKIFQALAPYGKTLFVKELLYKYIPRLKLNVSVEEIVRDYSYPKQVEKKIYPKKINAKVVLDKWDEFLIREMILHPECLTGQLGKKIIESTNSSKVGLLFQHSLLCYMESGREHYVSFMMDWLTVNEEFSPYEVLVGSLLYSFKNEELEEKTREKFVEDICRKIDRKVLLEKKSELIKLALKDPSLLKEVFEVEQKLAKLKKR